ncbi:hypothetical protein C7S15_2114 [Burkholderia cepacia]|nr:hypothetical protein [Burkholderia cepacia]
MQADFFRPGASLRQVAAAVKAGLFYFFRSTRFRLHFFCIFFETMFLEHKSPRVMTPGFVLIPVS